MSAKDLATAIKSDIPICSNCNRVLHYVSAEETEVILKRGITHWDDEKGKYESIEFTKREFCDYGDYASVTCPYCGAAISIPIEDLYLEDLSE